MGCGRSKPTFSSPRMVRSCNEEDFSSVIRENNETLEDHNSRALVTCCRRSTKVNKSVRIGSTGANEDHLRRDLHDKRDSDIKAVETNIDLNTINYPSLKDLELTEIKKYDVMKYNSLPTSEVESKFVKSFRKSDMTKKDSDVKKNRLMPIQSSSVFTILSPSKLSFIDDEYKNVVTEYSSSSLIESVKNDFEHPKYPNLIAVTGISYQHAQEIHRKYHLQRGRPSFDEKLSFQRKDMDSFSAGGYTSNDVEGHGFHKNDARFVEDCGSRSSGYQSGTSSIILDNSPIKTI